MNWLEVSAESEPAVDTPDPQPKHQERQVRDSDRWLPKR